MSGSSSTEGSREPDAVLGVDVGGTSIKTVVVVDGHITRSSSLRDRPVEELLPALVTSAAADHRITAVGVGLAGLVDHSSGRFVWGPHLSDVDIDVAGLLEPLVDSFVVDNDANLAAYAEWLDGAARGHRNALTISVGTGIGSGLVSDGSIVRGSGFAGEVGHMRIGSGDVACSCGRSGCWETVVSGRQLGLAAAALGLRPDAEALVAAAADGSAPARDALRKAGDRLGVGITNLILVHDPDVVVVAGGVSAAGDLILDAARERIASGLPGREHRPDVRIVEAVHGRWAAAIGAAHLAAGRRPTPGARP